MLAVKRDLSWYLGETMTQSLLKARLIVVQAIEKVKKENERQKEQVEEETRSRSDNSAGQSYALRLADQIETYKHKIETDERRLQELDKHHKIIQVSVLLCSLSLSPPLSRIPSLLVLSLHSPCLPPSLFLVALLCRIISGEVTARVFRHRSRCLSRR